MDTDSGTDGKGAVKTEYGVVKTDLGTDGTGVVKTEYGVVKTNSGTDGTGGVKTEYRVVKTDSDIPNGVGKTESDTEWTSGIVKTEGPGQTSPSRENNFLSHSSASPQNIGH